MSPGQSSCKHSVTDVIVFLLAPVIPQTGLPGVGPGGKAAKPGKVPVPGKYLDVSIVIYNWLYCIRSSS